MKKLKYILFGLVFFQLACEDPIEVELDQGEPLLVVDAWLNNFTETQTIKLSLSQPYFDSSAAQTINNAIILVTKTDGTVLNFESQGAGVYTYDPGNNPIGNVGSQYTLSIELDGKNYTATSTMNRVPPIDSIRQEFRDDEIFSDDGIYCELMSTDFEGPGDTYWIKTWKNGEYLNRDLEINIAFDAGFDSNGVADGVVFITPIRELINPLTDDLLVEPWSPGDSIYVEIHSLSEGVFDYMETFRDQLINSRNGIFAEPLANTEGNISQVDGDEVVLGVFNVAAISSVEATIR